MTLKLIPRPQLVRERIGETRQVSAIQETIKTLEKECETISSSKALALKTAMDGRFRLLAKCLPDLKAVEHTGDLNISHTITVKIG